MRVPIYLAGIASLIFSCKKSDNNGIINTPLPIGVSTTFLTPNIPETLQSVFFTSAETGFVGGGKGGIYKTVDSGKTWAAQNSTVNLPIYSLFFLNDQKGFAVGGEDFCEGAGCVPPGSFVLRTLNGGATWEKVYTLIEKSELSSVYFVNAATGFCAGGDLIIKTSDSGRTWNEYRVNDLGGKLMKITFTNTQKGYITSHAKIVATTDGGLTWRAMSTHQNPGYYAISAPGGVLYVAGINKMIKSSNEGAVWSELSNSPIDIFALHFINSKKGFAFGRGNYAGGDFGHSYASIYFTSDGGKTWSGSADYEDAEWIMAASFPTDSLGYAVSATRVIRIRVI
jgi:photosystem II stability/assembly factor-like uncharacterized protein